MKLRNKFFLVLVGVPTLAVLILLFVSIQVFVEDKKLFIFESQIENAQLLAKQILMDIRLHAGNKNSLQELEMFSEVFKSTSFNERFLINEEGHILASSLASSLKQQNSITTLSQVLSKSAVEKIADLSVNEGSFEDKSISNDPALFSFIRIPEEKMVLILQTPKTSAFRASTVFILKGLITLLGLVLSSTLASLLLSKAMTQNLTQLENSMRRFGEGDLETKNEIHSQDEIGKLGEYFNKMVVQIKNLMITQQEKIKLEFEMDLAGKLQARFFPPKNFTSDQVDFSGFYQASSQCGGDWWYYFTKGDHFVAFMGDVTGHGVKSALMTSASRSVFALIEEDFTDTALAMNILNKSFFAAAIGDVNMSAIIISLNMKTGELEYTNASHDPALAFSPKFADCVSLNDIHGMRLGTEKNSLYEKSKIQLTEGSFIFIYTDGLLEIKNSKTRSFKDRMIIKTCQQLITEPSYPLAHIQSDFQQKLIQFSGGLTNLEDDLSYFFIRYQAKVAQRSSCAG